MTNKLATSMEIGQKLIEALGLPQHCIWFELRCAAGEMATVKCEHLIKVDGDLDFKPIFMGYELMRRPLPELSVGEFDAWLQKRVDAAHAGMISRYVELSRMDARLLRAP